MCWPVMGERNWWEGRLLALCAKAEEGIGAGAGKDAEVLGRGEKINAGEIGAVEQEVHMAAAGRGTGGGGRGVGHGDARKLGDERGENA